MPTLYEIQLPAEVPNNVELPPVGNPAFASLALKYVNHWVNVWVPAFNNLNQVVFNNAKYAEQQAKAADATLGETKGVLKAALAAVADAQKAQFAAEQASGVQDWAPGSAYTVGDMRWGTDASGGQVFRCIAPVSGSNVPPQDDVGHWQFAGSAVSVDPTSGPTEMNMVRDADGNVVRIDFIQNGRSGSTELILDEASGDVLAVVTTYEGRTRTETPYFDADGVLMGMTAVVI